MAWDSAANILNDAAVELGLISTDITDPYTSTDPNIAQLRRFLKNEGQALVREFDWPHLVKTGTITTSNGTTNYQLPSDVARWLDQTSWNATNDTPLVGGISSVQWKIREVLSTAGTLYSVFRLAMSGYADEIAISPTPTAEETINFEYISRMWVGTEANVPTTDEPTSGIQIVYLDRLLLVAAVKLRFREAKGFDTTADERAFARALDRAKSTATAAPVLSLSTSRSEHLIDETNAPTTGIGLDGGGLG